MSTLQIGDKAPAFSGINQKGKKVSLADYTGKKLVLYFYPKDDTPGCTAQACNLTENHRALQKQGYAVLGVSPDTEKKHLKFIEKYKLTFDLLADTEKETIQAYGVWVEKSMYGKQYMGVARTTFILDEEGTIADIIEKVKTKDHTAQILK
jgi:peroxiredoxin Q/BCP|tara:strand:+ start:3147 stop:3599 length:453 start_codon:yes stop_codon:yes gene_type:complete